MTADQPTAGLDVAPVPSPVKDLRMACRALYLEVPHSIAADVERRAERVLDALEAVTRERDEARAALARVKALVADYDSDPQWWITNKVKHVEERSGCARLYLEAVAVDDIRAALATPEADR